MKYTVMLGIYKFEPPDGTAAISFAEFAQKYFVPSEYNKVMKPLIEIEEDKEKSECATE